LYNKSFPIDNQQYFESKDTLSKKLIRIIPHTDINREKTFFTDKEILGIIGVSHKGIDSDIYFMTDSFLVDMYGNIDKIDLIYFVGKYANNRAGDMLPVNYEPTL